ncbi:hypothetical protein OKW21_003551 [Catalinimonas alkaloidigena]|uniref:hypothetical protein n=1 Tax=Catalinimonas alkaloidigena TaxID=1075417 RepID=UPI002406D3DB|nr:hypothetical protein [Catalinimonas alkaloidigena]MDF9798288.1 hypothetical protein [Catalinimonas alkaloidigena]
MVLLLFVSQAHAQKVKQEYEKSIKEEEVPAEILDLIRPMLEESRRIRYYEEYDGEKTGYEIEMLWRDRQLSVEFYADGRLMDIEELIDFEAMEEEAREEIAEYFEEDFEKHKIQRLQRQYTPEESDDEDEELIEDFMEEDREDLTIRYEIVARVKSDKMYGPYEFLFDDEGELLNVQKIERRSLDNVLY